jgi:uncharacterized membrane protein YdjX (TVP38/TMEM64 family)
LNLRLRPCEGRTLPLSYAPGSLREPLKYRTPTGWASAGSSHRRGEQAARRRGRPAGATGAERTPGYPPPALPVRALRLAALLLVVTIVVIAWRYGVFQELSDPAQLARTLVERGAWGYLTFVLAYAALQPFGVPGTVFIMAAPLIWPWPVAFALSMTGTMAASVIGFSLSRLLLRDWVSRMIPARFRRYDEALATHALSTVFFLRLVFWMPPLLHAFFGVSKVRFWTHFWGSLLGYVLPLFVVSFFGQKVFDRMKSATAEEWIEVGLATALVALVAWAVQRRRRPTAPTDASAS